MKYVYNERIIAMLKRISAILIAMTLTIGCLASCGDKKEESSSQIESTAESDESTSDTGSIVEPSLTIDGEKVDTTDLVFCTIEGVDIGFDMFRYYYYYTLNSYESYYGVTAETLAEQEDVFDVFMKDVVVSIQQEFVAPKLAKEKGITLDETDEKTITNYISQAKGQFESKEEYENALKSQYMTEELYKTLLTDSIYYEKLFGTDGIMLTPENDFKKIVQDTDQYSRVIHILIPYECKTEITDSSTLDEYEDLDLSSKLSAKQTAFQALSEEDQAAAKAEAKKLADEVLSKAKNGEDFESLIKEYGWDPGMETSPEGYYVNENTSFVEEFKKAAFELKENEISGLVENDSYGWFIIKRLPVDMDYVEENLDTLRDEYDTPRIQELYQETADKMEITYGEIFEKITADSIT